MRVRGHFAGGTVVGAIVAGVGSGLGYLPGAAHPVWWAVFATTLFFALFPDVDTDSLPRRWFYKGVLAALLWLAWRGEWQAATGLAVLATLPLVDHHRGWTHGRWSPILVPATLGVACSWWQGGGLSGWMTVLTPQSAVFVVAAVAGWYTHLLLDGLLRVFPPDPM